MLTPEQLAALPEYIVTLYREFEDGVIADMARRLVKTGMITDTAEWQLQMLADMGTLSKDVATGIDRLTGISAEAVEDLFAFAAEHSDELAGALAGAKGVQHSAFVSQLLGAAVKQTNGDLQNLTRSLGFLGLDRQYRDITEAYRHALDMAVLRISSGTYDYNTAIRLSVKELADGGLRTVDYESGHHNRAEVAARRAVMTGVSQMTGEISMSNAAKLGTDFVEVTAHTGARPDHAEWQGKVYKLNGSAPGYPNISATGYGTGAGLKGWNCRHDFFPFIPGVSVRAYTDEELANIDPPPFEYEGKMYTAYDASQMQRRMETGIRQTKRDLIAYDAAELKDDYTAAAVKLRRQREYYKDFSAKAGLPLQNERAQLLGFGRSEAQKAVWAEKKSVVNSSNSGIIKSNKPLPNANCAVIPREKFTEYALNYDKDANKAEAFQKALGYTVENVDGLISNIFSHLPYYDAVEKSDNGYGKRYEVLMEITGPNGKTANVKTAWIVDKDTGETRLTSSYVTSRKWSDEK